MGASTDRTASAVQQAAGMMAIGLGLSAVAGWLADVPVLHTWRTRTVPMAPLTALLFTPPKSGRKITAVTNGAA